MSIQKLEQVTGISITANTPLVLALRSTVTGNIKKITLSCGSNLTSDATFDVNKGTIESDLATLFTPTKPKILSGSHSGISSGLNIAVTEGDLITVDVDIIGSGNTISFLTITIEIDDGVSTNTFQTSTYTSGSLANDAEETGVVALGKSFILGRVTADRSCRVTLYSTPSYRTTDASRIIGVSPTGEHGVIADFFIEGSNLTLDLSPFPVGMNLESTRIANIALRVQNKSGSTSSVAVQFSYLLLE